MNRSYDDIINLPHPDSKNHPRMPAANRAAQFSAFAALSGYDSAIKETARLTDDQITLSENGIEDLEVKLNILADKIADHPEVAVTHYVPDSKKKGGAYVTSYGAMKKIDEYEKVLVFADEKKIPIQDVLDIECGLFEGII